MNGRILSQIDLPSKVPPKIAVGKNIRLMKMSSDMTYMVQQPKGEVFFSFYITQMRAHKRNRAVFPAFESCCYRILVMLLCLLIYLRNLFVYGCVEKRTLKILKKYQYKLMNNGEDYEKILRLSFFMSHPSSFHIKAIVIVI